MTYPNRSSSVAFIAHAAGLPICAGCGVVLQAREYQGGSPRRWCSEACRTHARRRDAIYVLRRRPVEDVESASLVALRTYAGSSDYRLSARAAHLLSLVAARAS